MQEPATETSRHGRRRAQTRARLLEAARALISENGVDRLRITDLAERADVGAGTFYLHFSSKEEIVEAVVADSISAVAAGAIAASGGSDDPAVAVAVGSVRVVRIGFGDPDLARLLINLAHADALFGSSISPFARPLIEAGIASGRFLNVDVDVALTALMGATLAVIREAAEGRLAPGAEIKFTAMALALLGIERSEGARLAADAAVG